MITFTLKKGRDDDPEVLCLGFSHENLARLKEGQPIRIPAERLDPQLNCQEVLIFAGETEESMQAILKKWIYERGFSEMDVTDFRARKEVEDDLHQAGIIEDPDVDGGILG